MNHDVNSAFFRLAFKVLRTYECIGVRLENGPVVTRFGVRTREARAVISNPARVTIKTHSVRKTTESHLIGIHFPGNSLEH